MKTIYTLKETVEKPPLSYFLASSGCILIIIISVYFRNTPSTLVGMFFFVFLYIDRLILTKETLK